jgi:hypothetical protein
LAIYCNLSYKCGDLEPKKLKSANFNFSWKILCIINVIEIYSLFLNLLLSYPKLYWGEWNFDACQSLMHSNY